MPNHLHALIAFRNTKGESINKIVGNGKRFMAYDIVSRLKELNRIDVLVQLSLKVTRREKKIGKIHQVFRPSFDWKECKTLQLIRQKLNYIHLNPIKGKWRLAGQYWEYPHSSAIFFVSGKQGVYPVLDIGELEDIDLTVPFTAESPAGDSAVKSMGRDFLRVPFGRL
ncbi:MAG: hypothetical protein SH819_01330 [Cytophagales bacterium]|nr:hypothetical protein [Cytophagales bacterium]